MISKTSNPVGAPAIAECDRGVPVMCFDPYNPGCFNLEPGEKLKLSLVASLARDCEPPLNVGVMSRFLERRTSKERPNSREAKIPGPYRGGSPHLKALQERADEGCMPAVNWHSQI